MKTLVLLLMIVIGFNFVLKQSFRGMFYVGVLALLSAGFVALLWPVAIEQSKMQIPDLMLDTSVILTVDVALQMWFCILCADRLNNVAESRSRKVLLAVLSLFPGLLFFGVLFSLLVAVMFSFPGTSFALLGYGFAAVVMLCIPLAVWLIKKLLPEESIRLELLFLSNALAAILGVVATVNGRTAAEAVGDVNWKAFAAMVALLLAGTAVGYGLRKIIFKRKYLNNN